MVKTLQESWPRETLKAVLKGVQQDVEVEKKGDYFEVLNAPYVRGFSEELQRRLRKLGIGFVPKREETMYTNLCKLKQKVKFEDQKDVIYSVPCTDCKVRYVGETGQHFCDRAKQYQNDIRYKKSTNGIYAHLNPGKGINRGTLLNLKKGITLDVIWGTFNPELRKMATKKIMRRS